MYSCLFLLLPSVPATSRDTSNGLANGIGMLAGLGVLMQIHLPTAILSCFQRLIKQRV